MADVYIKLPPSAGGGGGVTSVFGRTGAVNAQAGDYTASQITNVPSGSVTSTDVQGAIDELASQSVTGNPDTFAGFDSGGVLESVPGFNIDTTSGGMNVSLTVEPDDNNNFNVNNNTLNIEPLQDSPDETWGWLYTQVNVDPNSSGFDFGTSGTAVRGPTFNVVHSGTSDIGSLELNQLNFNLGNGTDPIDVNGFGYSFGFGQVNSGVTISGPMQGYGYQPNIQAGATINSTEYTQAFYDASNIAVASPNYNSFNASPTINSIMNNNNFNGMNINPTITTMSGNSNFNGIAISGNLGTVGTAGVGGGYQGININPTITNNVNYAAGITVNMNNVTNAAGAVSSLVVQDITLTFNTAADNNNIDVEYTNTTTAGNEVASFTGGSHIVVSIQSGVSTATQVLAALQANPTLAGALTMTITGVASNPQVTYGPTNFVGGVNPGRKLAADLVGDVSIQGALSFTGGLSIGQLSSFASQDLSLLPGGVNSIDTLITQPFVAANDTVTGIDLLGVNTAMLLTLGDNATLTSSFLGIAALGLPAVVSLGTGATIDRVEGAVFAISLDAGATGGTIDEVNLCRALALPNGVTTVTRLIGYEFDLPFGDPGTTSWGFYAAPTAHNYFAGDLLIGGTAVSDDVVTNSSVALEVKSTTKAFLNARMTTTEKNALTAVAGMQVYDTTLNQMSYYNGTVWVNF